MKKTGLAPIEEWSEALYSTAIVFPAEGILQREANLINSPKRS
jgi:hypothetical protein